MPGLAHKSAGAGGPSAPLGFASPPEDIWIALKGAKPALALHLSLNIPAGGCQPCHLRAAWHNGAP